GAVEVGERPVDQLQLDFTAGDVGVAGGETLVQPGKGQADFGGHAGLVLLDDARLVAPGQKLRVPRHIGDEGIHFFGAVPDEDGLVDCFHRIGTACATDCIEAMRPQLLEPWPPRNKTPPPALPTTRRPPTTISSKNASRPAWSWRVGKSNPCAK